MTEYIVPFQDAESEFTEKRSRFITHLYKVETEAEARARIEETKKKYYDARHNCWCYLLRDGGVVRYSDDGEPQGTAGQPMLNVFQRKEVWNVCCIVTRYFGGTLLGAGGLVRAYTEGAAIAVRAARPRVMSPCTVLQMDIDYGQYGKITYILPKYHTVTLESDFGAAVRMQILIKDKYIEAFRKELTELTSATVVPYELEHRFDEIPE